METSFHGWPVRVGPGGVLRVLVIARISTEHQDARSLEDQDALCRAYVRAHHSGPVSFRLISGRGSGELLDRPDLQEAGEAIASGDIDLVVVEDLGRITRRHDVLLFIEKCLDKGIRLIALNDSLDTGIEGWRMNALFSSFRHESSNADTSKRIRRSLRNRFPQGGVVQTFPYGYIKRPGAKSDSDVERDPSAVAVYERWFSLLEEGADFAEVARWLNANNVPTGAWCKLDVWDGSSVGRVTRNPILKGVRRRNQRVAVRVHSTGRRITKKARPEEHLARNVPHLAFIDPVRYDALIATLKERSSALSRGHAKSSRPPRKRATWPAGAFLCGVCGRPYHWGGNGVVDSLMCSGAKEHLCWNGASFKGPDTCRRVVAALLDFAESTPGYDQAFLARVDAATRARDGDRIQESARLDAESKVADREVANLVDAVAAMGFSDSLQSRLKEAEETKARVEARRAILAREMSAVPTLPPVEDLKRMAREVLDPKDFADPAFGRWMARLVPSATVFPYRLPDGGKVVLRAELTLNLVPFLGPGGSRLDGLLMREVTLDLFNPPSRVAYRDRVLALRAEGMRMRDIAARLGVKFPTVQKGAKLDRMTREAGRTDPFVRMCEAPPPGARLRRQKHPEYTFRPLPGFPATPRDETAV